MKLKELVSSLKPSKELKELGVNQQDSFYYWVKKESSKIYQLFDRENIGDISFIEEMCSAYTFAELLEVLPDEIPNFISKTYNVKKNYYIHILKTRKSSGFVLPDYFIGYKTLDDRYLHSERADTIADAVGQMVIYLIKEGIIKET